MLKNLESESPLVSYCLFAYNQEKYIEISLKSALSQTYRPLELIVSDDCSTDGTFAVIERIASNYVGTIDLKINRNKENVGVIKHVEKIIKWCSGDFIVTAAGDDISTPERTRVLVDAWNRTERKECAIFSNAIEIDSCGAEGGLYFKREIDDMTAISFINGNNVFIGGFSQSFTPSLFTDFEEIKTATFQEDVVLAFRAILKDGIKYINNPLVYYRRHDFNSYSTSSFASFCRLCNSEFSAAKQALLDLNCYEKQDANIIKKIRYRCKLKLMKLGLRAKMPYLYWIRLKLREMLNASLQYFRR